MDKDTMKLTVWSLACGAPQSRTRCQLCEAVVRAEVPVSSLVGYGTLSHVFVNWSGRVPGPLAPHSD